MKKLVCILWCVYLVLQDTECDKVTMRLVEEPSNFGYNPESQSSGGLVAKVKPANISGPPMLKRLAGKCFDLVNDQYKYIFCPYHNVTQHEQSLRWNPYSGIIGVWHDWKIENNTYYGMLLKEGDPCGDKTRQALVHIECGQKNELTSVSEPSTCQYSLNFTTPLVCHQHAMLVYPTLSEDLQFKWDDLEGELVAEEITQQGYKKKLHKIFEEAGLVLSPTVTLAPMQTNKKDTAEDFDNLYTCNTEYKKLHEEIERLKLLVPEKDRQAPVEEVIPRPFHDVDYGDYPMADDDGMHDWKHDLYDY